MSQGRPRQFDQDEALSRAMQLFWRKGYVASGLTEILQETGMARQSLYNTFGDKKKLYLDCLTQYSAGWLGLVQESLNSSADVTDGLKQLLMAYIDVPSDIEGFGCMIVNAGCEFGQSDQKVSGIVTQHMAALDQMVKLAIEEGQRQGDISPALDAESASVTIVNAMHGLALMNRAGASRQQMLQVTQEIMRVMQP